MKYIQSVVIPLLVAILVGIGSSAVTSARQFFSNRST